MVYTHQLHSDGKSWCMFISYVLFFYVSIDLLNVFVCSIIRILKLGCLSFDTGFHFCILHGYHHHVTSYWNVIYLLCLFIWDRTIKTINNTVINSLNISSTFFFQIFPFSDVPWYSDSEWNNVKGQLSTIDRHYGHVHSVIHSIGTHQIHHLFTKVPHYHLGEIVISKRSYFSKSNITF